MEKEVPEQVRISLIKNKYLEKISEAQKSPAVDQKELFDIVKKFFAEYLKLDYEFTYEELTKELGKVFIKPALKKEIDDFLEELSESEYLSETELQKDEIKDYLIKTEKMINTLISDQKIRDAKKSIFDTLFKKSLVEPPPTLEEMPESQSKSKNPQVIQPAAQGMVQADAGGSTPAPKVEKMKVFGEEIPDMNNTQDNNSATAMFDDPEPITETSFGKPAKDNASRVLDSRSNISENMLFMTDDNSSASRVQEKTESADVEGQKMIKEKKQEEVKPAPKQERILKESWKNTIISENSSPDIVRIRQLIEEAYMQAAYNHADTAKQHYLEALEIYHKVPVKDKKDIYLELYDLFMKLRQL